MNRLIRFLTADVTAAVTALRTETVDEIHAVRRELASVRADLAEASATAAKVRHGLTLVTLSEINV